MTRRIKPLEELYFEWLCGPLDRKWDISFDEDMLALMHRTPFKPLVQNDQNRALDGIGLREEFLYECPVNSSPWEIGGWRSMPCSILEMLLALAERASYQTGVRKEDWFATFVHNLGLPAGPTKTRRVLKRLNERTYHADGGGGLFPLANPLEDQREVEIWYQMAAYVIENYYGEEG